MDYYFILPSKMSNKPLSRPVTQIPYTNRLKRLHTLTTRLLTIFKTLLRRL